MARVLVPLAPGCEELEAVTIIDLLRRAGIEVVSAGLESGPVRASRGVILVPEGRKLFPSLSVEENLIIGGQSKGGGDLGDRIDGFLSRFTGGPNPKR